MCFQGFSTLLVSRHSGAIRSLSHTPPLPPHRRTKPSHLYWINIGDCFYNFSYISRGTDSDSPSPFCKRSVSLDTRFH